MALVEHDDLESVAPGIPGLEESPAGAGDDADSGAPPVKTAEKAAKPDKQEAKQAEALQMRIRELEQENRFWAEKAKGASPAADPKKPAEPDELESLLASAGVDDDTAASLLDDIGEKGVAALEKRGLVTKAQLKNILSAVERRMEAKAAALADGKIAGARGQMSAEAKLLKDFPELADESSDIAKATAKEFAAMVAEDPSLQNSYTALRMAAKVAKSGIGNSLSDRMQRIASQAPSRGARPAASDSLDDDDADITPEARVLIEAGKRYGLTEDGYRKNARRIA